MSADVIKESVPSFVKRIGDHVIQGSNNTILILGTDRASSGDASVDDGLGNLSNGGTGTGTIHIIAGRKGKNPNLGADSSYLYVSQKTSADSNLGLDSVESSGGDGPALIGKSDQLRLVFRKNSKLASDDGSSYLFVDKSKMVSEASAVKLGKGASHPFILSNVYRSSEDVWFTQLVAQLTLLVAQVSAAGAALTAAAGLLPIPIAGAIMSAAPIGTAGAALTAASPTAPAISTALSTFTEKAQQYLSKKVTGE